MSIHSKHHGRIVATCLSLLCLSAPAALWAAKGQPGPQSGAPHEHEKTVDGLTVRIGLSPARAARQTEPGTAAHGRPLVQRGRQHLVVSLADARSGTPIRNAHVTAEVEDPLRNKQRKRLSPMATTGLSDYSGYFRFDMPGRYRIRVTVLQPGRTQPQAVLFTREIGEVE
ncbi:carboxypeptidase regulatory-like domain-containing protein [Thermithiobacillus tepidarius DSM 3134]|uniref:carboxypeptidase regulatory-like domain-containing protein n=1 Tax=Thermithiobacillus tepidarius TaxID=929 RepID=UPI000409F2B1|nr:carboxypeptidase regulatory-like domain-containing protein [Thermithiobacillus tepidarius]